MRPSDEGEIEHVAAVPRVPSIANGFHAAKLERIQPGS